MCTKKNKKNAKCPECERNNDDYKNNDDPDMYSTIDTYDNYDDTFNYTQNFNDERRATTDTTDTTDTEAIDAIRYWFAYIISIKSSIQITVEELSKRTYYLYIVLMFLMISQILLNVKNLIS